MFSFVGGGVGPGDLDVRPRNIGLVDVGKDYDAEVGPYRPGCGTIASPLVCLYPPWVALALRAPAISD